MRNRISKYLFGALGLFSTMPILEFNIIGHRFSIYELLLIFSVIYLIVNMRGFYLRIPSTNGQRGYLIWLFFGIISSFFGYVFFSGMEIWQSASLSYLFKIFIYILLFLLLMTGDDQELITSIVRGLIIGMIINLIWAFADAMVYYIFHYSLTNTLFSGYIQYHNSRYGMLALTIDGIIRSGGLNGDPSDIGMYSTIIAIFSLKDNKKILFILSILGVLASVSVIGLIGVIMALLIFGFNGGKANIKRIAPILGIGILGAIVLVSINGGAIATMRDAVLERLLSKTSEMGESSVRGQYFLNFIPAVFSNPWCFIIGTGFGTASYAYLSSNLTTHISMPYDPECTYFSYFFDTGLIGFIFFCIAFWEMYKISKILVNESTYGRQLYACVLGCSIAFWGYHYILFAPCMLIMICGLLDTRHLDIVDNCYENG